MRLVKLDLFITKRFRKLGLKVMQCCGPACGALMVTQEDADDEEIEHDVFFVGDDTSFERCAQCKRPFCSNCMMEADMDRLQAFCSSQCRAIYENGPNATRMVTEDVERQTKKGRTK